MYFPKFFNFSKVSFISIALTFLIIKLVIVLSWTILFHQEWLRKTVLMPFILLSILSLFSYIQMRLSRTARMVNKFPQGIKLPFFGTLYQIIAPFEQINGLISKYVDSFGRCCAFWIGHTPYVLITDGKSAQKILLSNSALKKGKIYNQLKWAFGNGLVTSHISKWQKDRKLLSPGFKYKNLHNFLQTFNKYGDILLKNLSTKFSKNSEPQSIHSNLSGFTMDSIIVSVFNKEFNIQKDPDSKFISMANFVLESSRAKIFKPWLSLPIIKDYLGYAKGEPKIMESFKEILAPLIDARKDCNSNHSIIDADTEFAPLIDLLLTGNTDSDLFDHAITILGAGFETTSSAINFALYLLALNPECQKRVHEEIDSVYDGDKTREITMLDLSKLKYLELCIKETLRLFPPAPLMVRVSDEDIQLDNGKVIPRGCNIGILMYELQRDPEAFPEPNEFIPNRFLPETCSSFTQSCYMPFAVGPRNCIGQKYAMMQIKTALALLLRRFEVSTDMKKEDLKVLIGIVLEVHGGIQVSLQERPKIF